MRAGEPSNPETTLGPVSSERAMKLLLNQIEIAEEGGARVVVGGGRVDRPGFYVDATVLTDINRSNPIYSQELFGPVASIYVVSNEEEAIKLANDTPFGLGGAVFSADPERGRSASPSSSTAAWSMSISPRGPAPNCRLVVSSVQASDANSQRSAWANS